MPKLRFSNESKQDLKDIVQYIARDKPKAARSWAERIRVRCQGLASQPNLGDLRSEFGTNVRSVYLGHYLPGPLCDLLSSPGFSSGNNTCNSW